VAEEVDEDDILAILDRDEVAFGDAIGDDRDEDFIPGPDDDEGSGDDDGEADADLSSSSDEIATSSGGAEMAAEVARIHQQLLTWHQPSKCRMTDARHTSGAVCLWRLWA
jgi:hypothetical protein